MSFVMWNGTCFSSRPGTDILQRDGSADSESFGVQKNILQAEMADNGLVLHMKDICKLSRT